VSERLQRLRHSMANVGLDALIVGAPVEDTFHTHAANRRYLSDFSGSMGWLLITPDSAFIAVDFRYFEQAEREAPGFTLFRTNGGMESWLSQLLGEAGLAKVRLGFEPGGVTVSTYQAMKKALDKLPADGASWHGAAAGRELGDQGPAEVAAFSAPSTWATGVRARGRADRARLDGEAGRLGDREARP
jgi:hypothetical protein